MSLSIQVNNETFSIPADIHDVTLGMFLKLRHIDLLNDLHVFEWAIGRHVALTDMPQTIKEVASVLALTDPVLQEIFNFMKSDARIKIPNKVELLGYKMDVKSGILQSLPYWATVRCKQAMIRVHKEQADRTEKDYTEIIPEILAHYLYPLIAKQPYNEAKADEFAQDIIMDMPMIEAIQLGNFFLLRQIGLFLNRRQRFFTWLHLTRLRLIYRFFPNMGMSALLKR